MEKEAQTLCDFICRELLPSPFSLVLDCHSGFGYLDRIWFPYASSRKECIDHIGEVYYLRKLFQQTYPYQNYCFEPQSQHYLTHRDLWDFLYLISLNQNKTFLPLTLEMGSWRWIRKTPMQIFNQLGMFHPIKPHRVNRVLRGHLILMEFLLQNFYSMPSYPMINGKMKAPARLWQNLQNHFGTIMPINKTFLLLRGLMREQRHWEGFPDVLQTQFPDAEIITPDIPGNGLHFRSRSPDSIEKITDSVRQVIAVSHNSRQINIIALSMGGMSAIDWMCRYPDEIASAVLINTSTQLYSPFFQRLRWQSYLSIMRLIFQKPQQQELMILKLTSNQHNKDRELLQRWCTWRRQYPVSMKSAYNQLLASATFKSTEKPEQPILIMASKADRLVDYRCSLVLQHAWKTAYQEHPTAGHDLPLDDPDWVAEKLYSWYASIQKTGR